MHLLVTGGGGFVMSHLVRRWLDRNHDAWATVIDAAPADRCLERFLSDVRERFLWLTGNVADPDTWKRIGHSASIDFLVHGAAATSINRRVHANGRGQPGLAGALSSISSNIDGSLQALAWAQHLPALSRMVYVSSGSVYGDHGPVGAPLPEDGYVEPSGIYAITKHVAELFSRYCAEELGVPVISVRLSGVFGPMDRETATRCVRCAPNRVAELGLRGATITVRSTSAVGDFIHADDVADAIISLLIGRDIRHPVYNIAAGEVTSIGALLALGGERIPGLRFEARESGEVDIDYDPHRRTGRWGAYDLSRIRADTGWRPRSLRESFHDYIDWLARSER